MWARDATSLRFRANRALAALLVALAAIQGILASLPFLAVRASAAPLTVSVLDYGAKGDGVTDDSAAIQLAVRAGAAPRVVRFPRGDYVFANVVVPSHTALVFEAGAQGLAPLTATSSDVFFSLLGTAASRVTSISLEGGVFRGRPTMGGVVVAKYADDVRVTSVDSIDVVKNVSSNLSSHVVVRDCSAQRARWGFAFEQSEYVEVSGCRVKSTVRDGILFYGRSRNITATANRIEDYMTGGDVGVGGIQVYGSTVATITGNVILDGNYDSAGIRFRDAESFWCEGNYVASPGSSGLSVVRVGDYPGLDGGNGTFIGNTVERANLRGIDVANSLCKPVHIIGNVILDTTTASTVSAATGIVALPSGSTVIGNRIEVCTGPGIHIGGSGQVVAWNRVHNVASVNFGPRVGVFVTGTGHAVVGNDIEDELRNMFNGIRVYAGGSALLRDNVITGASLAPYDIRGSQLTAIGGDSAAPSVVSSVTAIAPTRATVRVTATDARSAVAATRVSVDGEPARFFQGGAAEVTVRGAGSHSVTFSALDAAGNASSSSSAPVAIESGAAGDSAATSITTFIAGTQATTVHPPVGAAVTVLGSVRDESGSPLHSPAPLRLQRWVNGMWVDVTPVGSATAGSIFYRAVDLAGSYRFHFPGDGYHSSVDGPVITVSRIAYESIQGSDRIGTALAASKVAFAAGSAGTVVVCTAYNFPDALGGSALAGAYGAPLLLTPVGVLPSSVADEIVRVGAKDAVVIGSESVVSAAVAQRLGQLLGGGTHVTRIAGANRYETAAKIARATGDVLRSRGRSYDGTVLVATGANFPDALAASPLAAAKGWPILLAGATLPDCSVDALRRLGATRAIVLGSNRAVSDQIAARLQLELGAANVSRLQGSNRYQTAAEIAQFGVRSGLSWDGVALSTGENFPDALAGGVMQARLGSVVLLTPTKTLDPSVRALLVANKAQIHAVRYLGAPAALSLAVRDTLANALW